MTVIRAATLGTCRGVQRALAILERTLAEHPGEPVYTLGPLIHNPRVVEEYRRRGVVPVGSLSEVDHGIVVIRAHGIGPAERALCGREGVTCVDATCPDVLRVQDLVREHAARGDGVVIVGDPGHVEVKGIRGYAPGAVVVSTEEEAEAVVIAGPCIAVGQTTFPRDRFLRIAGILRRRVPGLEVHETSCPATERRQQSLVDLAREGGGHRGGGREGEREHALAPPGRRRNGSTRMARGRRGRPARRTSAGSARWASPRAPRPPRA